MLATAAARASPRGAGPAASASLHRPTPGRRPRPAVTIQSLTLGSALNRTSAYATKSSTNSRLRGPLYWGRRRQGGGRRKAGRGAGAGPPRAPTVCGRRPPRRALLAACCLRAPLPAPPGPGPAPCRGAPGAGPLAEEAGQGGRGGSTALRHARRSDEAAAHTAAPACPTRPLPRPLPPAPPTVEHRRGGLDAGRQHLIHQGLVERDALGVDLGAAAAVRQDAVPGDGEAGGSGDGVGGVTGFGLGLGVWGVGLRGGGGTGAGG
jgi:hypothetical protein